MYTKETVLRLVAKPRKATAQRTRMDFVERIVDAVQTAVAARIKIIVEVRKH